MLELLEFQQFPDESPLHSESSSQKTSGNTGLNMVYTSGDIVAGHLAGRHARRQGCLLGGKL